MTEIERHHATTWIDDEDVSEHGRQHATARYNAMRHPTLAQDDSATPSDGRNANTYDSPQFRAEQLQQLMEGVVTSIPGAIVIAVVMAYVQWPLIEHTVVIGWLGSFVLVSLLRAALAFSYFKTRAKLGSNRLWLAAFIAGTAMAGTVWGLGAWILYPPNSVAHQAFLGVLVAGLTAGAVTTLSASLIATLVFLSLSQIPIAVRFLSSGQEIIFALGLLTILFFAVTTIGAQRMNHRIVQNVRLRLDASDRALALRNSNEQAQKLSMVAARTDNAVIITDSCGRVEWVNEGFGRMTGYTLADVVARTPGSVLQGPETDAKVVQRMREKLRQHQGFEEEIQNYAKDGRIYWVSIEVRPIKNEAGETIQFMAIERDITESRLRQRQLEEARQRAEEASQAKSNFLAMMGHEVRTPLNGVLGSLSLLQDTLLDAEQRKYTETSRRSAEWLLSIINDILDFSKMEAGKIELEPAVFGIRDLVDSVVEMLEPRASEKAISVIGEIDPAVPAMAEGDSTKIRQVLLNLAGNGVKFTSAGEVRIRVDRLEENEQVLRLRFSVSDTGVGIEDDEQQQVFDEFWTRSTETSQGATGTGLGLSISHRLVRMMGGDIHLTSQRGVGSRFWFDVPLTPASAEATTTEQARINRNREKRPGSLSDLNLKGRVLLAEDNPANQMIGRSLLARLGLTVDVVANGLEAVDAVRNRPYDLVLMDIGMPLMDGVQATRAIRAMDGAMAQVPIVAVTAHVMRGERESLLAQGLDDYLGKPIDRAAMIRCLTHWLTTETETVAVADDTDTLDLTPETDAPIDRSILQQLLDDVGPENAQAVVDAFVEELGRQTVVLDEAASRTDLDAVAQAAHRLKSSAASFGAMPLSRVVAAIEQAARTGQTEAAIENMGEFRKLAIASQDAMAALRAEVFGQAH